MIIFIKFKLISCNCVSLSLANVKKKTESKIERKEGTHTYIVKINLNVFLICVKDINILLICVKYTSVNISVIIKPMSIYNFFFNTIFISEEL